MKRLIILVLVMLAGLTQIVQAQVRGVPPSVTSLAPGRQFLPGPSVTSLGPHGYSHSPVLLGNRGFVGPRRFIGPGRFNGRFFGSREFRRFRGRNAWPVFVPMYSPYGTTVYPLIYGEPYVDEPNYSDSGDTSTMYQPDPNYAGQYGLQPPVKPRNQPIPPDYSAEQPAAPADNTSTNTQPSQPVQTASAVEPQPTTVLVFKDGHKLDVTNYVIQGQTLYNLGDNGPRKVALADLDLKATVSANDDRGVEFQLP